MSTEIIIQEERYVPATVTQKRGNYELALPSGQTRVLQRGTDFGNPKKKDGSNVFPQPILYKGGAEKIIHDYKVLPRYELIHAVREWENGFFYFEMKCSLVAINPATGAEIVIQEGYGSANTRESKTGTASGFDQANPSIKSAKKRAMVDAIINLAGLSTIFTQDLENDLFQKEGADFAARKDDDAITSKQRQRIFSIAATKGLSAEQAKNWLKAEGFATTKDIKQKDYDGLCDKLNAMEE